MHPILLSVIALYGVAFLECGGTALATGIASAICTDSGARKQ